MSHKNTTRQQDAGAATMRMDRCFLALAVRLVVAGVALASPFAYAQQAAPEATVELGATAITDTATAEDDATTEGTQSYTTRAARTATPLSMSLRETPQSVSVVTRQRMDDQDLQTITDVMNNATGVSVNRYETDRAQFNARGFDINSLMIDGVPTIWEQPWSGGEMFSSLAMYDRVEVVRGANGLMSGAGDPSATINMVRKRASSKELTGSIQGSAGSWDTYGALGDISMPLNEAGTVRARLVGELNDGDSWIDMKSNKRETLYGTMDIDLTADTTLWFGLSRQKLNSDSPMWGGLPIWYSDGSRTNWSRSKTASADWSKWDTSYETYFINLDHNFANGWQANLSYNHAERNADSYLLYLYTYADKNGSEPMSAFPGSYKTRTKQDDYSIRVNGPVSVLGRDHELAFGYVHSDQDFDADSRSAPWPYAALGSFDEYEGDYPEPAWGALSYYGQSELQQRAMYGVARLNLRDDLKLILGARNNSYRKSGNEAGASSRVNDTDVTPYAGVIYDLTENLSAYVSYTDIFLPQARREVSGKQLAPVMGKSYETGLKGEFLDGRLNASAAVFQIDQQGLGQATSSTVVGTVNERAYTAEDVTSKGFELEVSGELAEGWNASAGYTQFKVRKDGGGAANTLYPTKLLRTFTTYRLPGAFNKLTIGGGVNWQNAIYTYADNPQGDSEKITQGAYALVNLMARYEITDNLSAQLNANNITDKKYYDLFDAYGAMTYGAPRSLTASAKYSF